MYKENNTRHWESKLEVFSFKIKEYSFKLGSTDCV